MRINFRLLESSERTKKEFYIYRLYCKEGENVISPHWHDEFEVLYTTCDGVIELDRETIEFSKDNFIFINKEQIHSVRASSDGHIYALVFAFESLSFVNNNFCQTEIIDKLNNMTYLFPQYTELEEELQNKILELLGEIIELYLSDTLGRELKMKCNLYEIIFLIYSNGKFIINEKDEKYNCIQLDYARKVIQYMENNFSENITIDKLAKKLSLNKHYLIKIFKQITGETPIIYLRNLRIDFSKDLLKQGYSITEAATLSGFNNISYYIRHFKDKNSVTPKEYQKNNI